MYIHTHTHTCELHEDPISSRLSRTLHWFKHESFSCNRTKWDHMQRKAKIQHRGSTWALGPSYPTQSQTDPVSIRWINKCSWLEHLCCTCKHPHPKTGNRSKVTDLKCGTNWVSHETDAWVLPKQCKWRSLLNFYPVHFVSRGCQHLPKTRKHSRLSIKTSGWAYRTVSSTILKRLEFKFKN